jgi:hypothetical protein
LPNEYDGELSGERPDLLEELDERSLGLGHEPESTTQPSGQAGRNSASLVASRARDPELQVERVDHDRASHARDVSVAVCGSAG